MDANSKLGSTIIPGDPCEQSKNGKLLLKVIEDNDLIVVNGTDLCKGIVTRYRQTKNSTEKSVLDYFLGDFILQFINIFIEKYPGL